MYRTDQTKRGGAIVAYEDVMQVRVIVGNDTTSRLLVGIASFASALIEYTYGRMVTGRTSDDY